MILEFFLTIVSSKSELENLIRMSESTIYTLGHGNKTIDVLIEELKHFDIEYLIDIRSKPYSKYNPQFNKNELKGSLCIEKIRYTFMGDVLGGLPTDVSCYTNGHVDYDKLKKKDFFKNGLLRLVTANTKRIKVAILCSESKPEECHRTKLIGEELINLGIEINHITTNHFGNVIILSQREVMQIVAPCGTVDLFGEKLSFGSRKKYPQGVI